MKKGSKTQSKKLKKSRQLKAAATEGGEGGSIIDEDAVLPTDAAKCTAEAEAAAQAAKAKERQAVAPRNTALLRQQSPALAEEYMEGGWAHAVVQPEAVAQVEGLDLLPLSCLRTCARRLLVRATPHISFVIPSRFDSFRL